MNERTETKRGRTSKRSTARCAVYKSAYRPARTPPMSSTHGVTKPTSDCAQSIYFLSIGRFAADVVSPMSCSAVDECDVHSGVGRRARHHGATQGRRLGWHDSDRNRYDVQKEH